eukprot:gene7030-8174_t
MTRCGSCGNTNSPSAKFCVQCGNGLATTAKALPKPSTGSSSTPALPPKTSTLGSSTDRLKPLPTVPKVITTPSSATFTAPIVKPLPKPTPSSSTPSHVVKPIPQVAKPTASSHVVVKPAPQVVKPTATKPPLRSNSLTKMTATAQEPENFMNVKLKETTPVRKASTSTSSTVSLVTLDEKPKVASGSFVKLAAMSRDNLDSLAQRDSMIINGVEPSKVVVLPTPQVVQPPVIVASTTTTTTTTTMSTAHKKSISSSHSSPEPPKKPAHLSTQISTDNMRKSSTPMPIPPPAVEKVVQPMPSPPPILEKEAERERQKAVEKESEKERAKHEKEAEKERAKQEKERAKQAERDRKIEERERQKVVEKDTEKDRSKQEKEAEKERAKQEKERAKLERERSRKDSMLSSSPRPSSPVINSQSMGDLPGAETGSPKPISFADIGEMRAKDSPDRKSTKRDRSNTGASRFFSFILGAEKDKDVSSDDEFVISSPTPIDGRVSPAAHISSPPAVDSDSEEPQLRKWAIKRNEYQKSERDLLSNSGGSVATGSVSNGPPSRGTSMFVVQDAAPATSPPTANGTGSKISLPSGPPALPPMPSATDQRSRVIEEVIVTEADYIRDLEIMVWLRKEMAAAAATSGEDANKTTAVLPADEINILFCNVEQLLLVNRELYSKFCEPSESGDYGEAIAMGFIVMAEFLKSYFVYCSNQQKALQTFSSLRGKNCSYLGYLLSRRECRSLPFDSFLIKPVQRVCKYPLLLRELIKSTPTTSPSHAKLLAAQTKIEMIVGTVNERKREFDGQMKMYDIQQRLFEGGTETSILSPSRRMVKEGALYSMGYTVPGNPSTAYNKKAKEGYYYLFNDLFIYTQLTSTGAGSTIDIHSPLKLKAHIPLDECVIRQLGTADPNAFEIIYSNQQVWMFVLASPEACNSVFNEIDQLKESILKNEYRKFVEEHERLEKKSKVETFDEWRLIVRDKPLPEPPKSSPLFDSPRLSKALPIPPPNGEKMQKGNDGYVRNFIFNGYGPLFGNSQCVGSPACIVDTVGTYAGIPQSLGKTETAVWSNDGNSVTYSQGSTIYGSPQDGYDFQSTSLVFLDWEVVEATQLGQFVLYQTATWW